MSARHSLRDIQHTVDLMALAGAQELPGDPTLARTRALEEAARNGIASPPYTITVTTDNTCWNTDPLDNPTVIDSMTTTVIRNADRYFAKVFNTGVMTVGAKAKACWGAATVPVDLVIVIDRSGSMSSADVTNAKNAAKSVLQFYDPTLQQVAFGVLGPSYISGSGNICNTSPNVNGRGKDAPVPVAANSSWVPVPFSTDFKSGGSLNTNSLIVKTINCLETSSVGTDLANPMTAAANYLTANGRAGVKKGIIFMTDGAAKQSGSLPCRDANNAATAGKAAGIEVFTIAFGVESGKCVDDESGAYSGTNGWVTKLLADMATTSTDNNNHCQSTANQTAENADGDHFLCAPRSEDLTPVFQAAAKAFAGITLVE